MEDFEFLLARNYHVKDFENIPLFYKDILLYFMNWRLYECDVGDTTLFNNKKISIEGKTFFLEGMIYERH